MMGPGNILDVSREEQTIRISVKSPGGQASRQVSRKASKKASKQASNQASNQGKKFCYRSSNRSVTCDQVCSFTAFQATALIKDNTYCSDYHRLIIDA